MNFVYQGFTHDGPIRAFVFHGIEQSKVPVVFSIEVDLPLFARNHVAMQDAPMFCLRMLTTAFAAGDARVGKIRTLPGRRSGPSFLVGGPRKTRGIEGFKTCRPQICPKTARLFPTALGGNSRNQIARRD